MTQIEADGFMGAETYMQDLTAWMQALIDDWNIKLCLSSVMAFFTSVFGTDSWLIECLFFLLLADLCLGITCALRFDGCLSGRRLHDGVIKFGAYAASIVLVWLVQEICRHAIPVDLPVLAIYAAYQSLTEVKSVSKHLERLGLKMPALFHRIAGGAEDKIEEVIEENLTKHKDTERDVPDTDVGDSEEEVRRD